MLMAHSKYELECEKMSAELPPLSDKQEQWMLKQVDMTKPVNSWNELYCTIITTHKHNQVFRVFQVYVSAPQNRNGYAENNSIHKTIQVLGECYQIWINRQGERALIGYKLSGVHLYSRACHTWQRYESVYKYEYDKDGKCIGSSWTTKLGKMQIKKRISNNPQTTYYYDYGPFLYPTTSKEMLGVYPRKRFLPEFIRNNHGTDFHGYEGDDAVRYMLNPLTEKIFKIAPKSVFDRYRRMTDREQKKFFTPIRIALKHKYHIETNLESWIDLVRALLCLKKDVHNPALVAPKNFCEVHDKYIKMYAAACKREDERKRILKQLSEAERNKIENEVYVKRISRYLDINISDNDYDIFVCPSIMDMASEGAEMHHCVYSMKYYEKNDCIILFCRKKNGERVTTIDLRKDKDKGWRINQCYAKYDKIHADDKHIRQLLTDNFHLFDKANNKKIIPLNTNTTAEQPQQVALAA